MKKMPVYRIEDFEFDKQQASFYANRLNKHVKEHAFTSLPHKHDFYLVLLITAGNGWHEIDFIKYPVKPGSVFLMQPGQMHYWKLSENIDGFVFFHSKAFYEEGYTFNNLHEFSFYKSFQSAPYIQVDKKNIELIAHSMRQLVKEFKLEMPYKFQKLHSLINLAYIELARIFTEKKVQRNQTYLEKLHQFEVLIEKHYKERKLPGFYAGKLNITEKHLNRITRECLNKTSTQLIADRIVLEAKRLLMYSGFNVTEIGYELGFNDKSYFVRFFKKQTGKTPLDFARRYKMQTS